MTKKDIERMALKCFRIPKAYSPTKSLYDILDLQEAYCIGAEQVLSALWKDAQGDDLPEYGREVIALYNYLGHWKIQFAHRPDPNEYVVVEGEKLYAKTYGKGWNWDNIALWLDVELPKDLED